MREPIFGDDEIVIFKPITTDNSIETVDELSYKPKLIT